MNVGNPDRAFDFACLPNEGVGLARLEFIINRMIGVHPRALLEFDDRDAALQNDIREMMKGFDSPREFYVGRLTEGIATLGAAFYPKRVIVRLSDFKSNEYANWSAANAMSRMKKTRCWASAARVVTSQKVSAIVLRWNAKR